MGRRGHGEGPYTLRLIYESIVDDAQEEGGHQANVERSWLTRLGVVTAQQELKPLEV